MYVKFWGFLRHDREKAEENSIRLYDVNRMSKAENFDSSQSVRGIDFTTLKKQNPDNFSASSIYTGDGQFYFILQIDLKKEGFSLKRDQIK